MNFIVYSGLDSLLRHLFNGAVHISSEFHKIFLYVCVFFSSDVFDKFFLFWHGFWFESDIFWLCIVNCVTQVHINVKVTIHAGKELQPWELSLLYFMLTENVADLISTPLLIWPYTMKRNLCMSIESFMSYPWILKAIENVWKYPHSLLCYRVSSSYFFLFFPIFPIF